MRTGRASCLPTATERGIGRRHRETVSVGPSAPNKTMAKRIHVGALSLFRVALVCYAASWLPGAIGFAVFWMVFEIAAWIALLTQEQATPSGPEE
jgi:hypothetical protein